LLPLSALHTLSLHDALPISATPARRSFPSQTRPPAPRRVSSMQQTRQEHPMYARSTPVPLAVVAAFVLAGCGGGAGSQAGHEPVDRKSTRLNSSHVAISYAV